VSSALGGRYWPAYCHFLASTFKIPGGYSPNFWPKGGELKTYLGCHGEYSLFAGQKKCPDEGPKCKDGYLDIPSEFELTHQESACLQMRLFNPQRTRMNAKPALAPDETSSAR
jgi:hypothetical protein